MKEKRNGSKSKDTSESDTTTSTSTTSEEESTTSDSEEEEETDTEDKPINLLNATENAKLAIKLLMKRITSSLKNIRDPTNIGESILIR